MASKYFSVHTHSNYSALDGMTKVSLLVQKAAMLKHPAMALTDHGNMAGTVDLYKSCKQQGILPFPGCELYLLDPQYDGDIADASKATRYHLGMLALSERGYKGLVGLVSLGHTRPRFSRFPRITLSDLAEFGQEYGKHVALTTGCYFGLLQQTLVQQGEAEAERIVKMYAQWFPNTIVEIQNHNISHDENEMGDDQIVKALYDIGMRQGLPMVATQDSHYLHQKEKTAHALMKRMVYGGAEDEFPGDSFHLASGDWVAEHYTDEQWTEFEGGYAYLLDHNKVKITPLDTFKVDVPGDYADPDALLRKKCLRAHAQYMKTRPKKIAVQRYEDELAEELSVFTDLGMAGYILIWDKFVRWCKQQHICVEARGSANGSYICYLLGITQVDPVFDGCMFERFLSRDRIKSPDIDLDIEDGRRMEALYWLHNNYDSVQISTWSQLGITINPETGEQRGSVFATWQQGMRRMCESMAWDIEQENAEEEDRKPVKHKAITLGKQMFAKEFGWMKGMDDVRRAGYKDDYKGLRQIDKMKSVYRSYGTHAGGVLLSGNHVTIEDYIPRMLVASSDTVVSQYDMDAVEEFGLLKMDVLGQTSLAVMRRCQVLMGKSDPTDFSWIPRDDRKALALLRTGRTDTGIFHFEGYALRDDMPVLTADGWTPISLLRVGDHVKDPDGGNAKVTGVYPQGECELFEVTLTDGSSVICTEDHLWTTTVNSEPEKVRTTGELLRMIESTTMVPKLRGFTPSNFGSTTDKLIDPYVLGLLLGDGSFRNKYLLRFSSADDELVNAITDAYPHIIHREDGEYGHYFNNTKRIRTDLEVLGLSGLGSEDKFVPDGYKWASLHDRLAILQGLMDTDGTVETGGRGRFVTVSPQLAEDVKWLVYSLGGKCKLTAADRGDMDFFNGSVSPTKTIYTVGSIRLPQNNPFRLKRKADKYRDSSRRHGYAIASIVPVGRGHATCISVSSKSECFITKDWIVTHNTKSKGGRELGVKSVRDAILVQALYMPGCMDIAPGQSISMKDLYLKRRRDPAARASVTYIHPAFERALAPTYGCVVFQEQVIQIMRDLGMSIASINKFFKVVKDSGKGALERNAKRMDEVRDEFDEVCHKNGIDPDAAWVQTASFVAYGFNRNHATGYGIRSYRTAYLKAYYPLEYMTALLQSWAGRDKEKVYIREARRMEIPILPPDINNPSGTWAMDKRRGAIRRGLVSIAGIGMKVADEIATRAPFNDMDDFCQRCNGHIVTGAKHWREGNPDIALNTGVIKKLHEARVLDPLLK